MTAESDLVLGIDIGTSGVRVVAVDVDDVVVAAAAAATPSPTRQGSRVTQDAEIWWEACAAALRQVLAKVDPHTIGAVAVDGTSGTLVAIDAEGTPVGPASLYNDACSPDLAALVAAHAPEGSAARGSTSSLGRAIELQTRPGVVRLLHQADWIAGRLLGRFALADENNALKTGYDPLTRRWPDWIGDAGLSMRLLPDVVPAGTPFGDIGRSARDTFGFSPRARVVAGTTDGCAAFLATGATEPGEAVTSLGSTLVLKLLSPTPLSAPGAGIYSHRIGDMWLAGGASNSGGAALLRFFSAEAMARLEPDLHPDTPTGLDFYPLPAPGERFPVNDPAYPSRTDPRPESDAAFLQGLLEGVAAVEALGYRRLGELGGPPLVSVRAVGGGARNAAWRKIRSRLLGVPLLASRHPEAACGAAWLARRGLR